MSFIDFCWRTRDGNLDRVRQRNAKDLTRIKRQLVTKSCGEGLIGVTHNTQRNPIHVPMKSFCGPKNPFRLKNEDLKVKYQTMINEFCRVSTKWSSRIA
jgi:hypothetical protein